ncbi:MAG TPA: response regulator transcription factor [Actinocatenispora sp.]
MAQPDGGQGTRRQRILVVEDDPTVAEVVTGYLHRANFIATVAPDGDTGLELAEMLKPDLIVLDLMLPGTDGMRVCRRLRERSQVPIIMLTALSDEENRLQGLTVGADDYLTKPFSPRELVLRVRSVLRRVNAAAPVAADDVLRAGRLTIDPTAHTATKDGVPLALTAREFDLLAYLMRRPGRVLRRDELMRGVWAYDFGDASTVTVHVRRLREKIEDDPAHPTILVTVWGMGYRFEPGPPGSGA